MQTLPLYALGTDVASKVQQALGGSLWNAWRRHLVVQILQRETGTELLASALTLLQLHANSQPPQPISRGKE